MVWRFFEFVILFFVFFVCVIFNFFWGDFLNVFLFVCIFSIELRVCVFFFSSLLLLMCLV